MWAVLREFLINELIDVCSGERGYVILRLETGTMSYNERSTKLPIRLSRKGNTMNVQSGELISLRPVPFVSAAPMRRLFE